MLSQIKRLTKNYTLLCEEISKFYEKYLINIFASIVVVNCSRSRKSFTHQWWWSLQQWIHFSPSFNISLFNRNSNQNYEIYFRCSYSIGINILLFNNKQLNPFDVEWKLIFQNHGSITVRSYMKQAELLYITDIMCIVLLMYEILQWSYTNTKKMVLLCEYLMDFKSFFFFLHHCIII